MASATAVARDCDASDHADLDGFVANPDLPPIEAKMSHNLLPVLEDHHDLGRSVQRVVVTVRGGAVGKHLVEQRQNLRFEPADEAGPVCLEQLHGMRYPLPAAAAAGVLFSRRLEPLSKAALATAILTAWAASPATHLISVS